MRFMNSCLIKNLPRHRLQRLAYFSSSPATTLQPPRFSSLFYDDSGGDGSAVYQHKLMFQRPTVIKWQQHLQNTVSFIGSVDRPPKQMNTKYGDFGVHTLLKVNHSRDSDHEFRIRLLVWDELGKICMKHLKSNDFIYVSGRLLSYTKPDENGSLRLYYSVNVKELNYVAQCSQHPRHKKSEESQSGGGEAGMEKYENNLYLWQVFFTNPYEWWDNRKNKRNPKQPDFKHKDTKEALWLRPNDPSWVKRQLELLDSSMANQGQQGDTGHRTRVSMWLYDE